MYMANKSKEHTENYEKCLLLLKEFSEQQLARVEVILREVKTAIDEAGEAARKNAYLSGKGDDFAMRATKKFESGDSHDKIAVTGVSQILCKHRRVVKNRAKLFVGVVACPPPLEFTIGREMCACQGPRLEGRCSFNP